MHKKYIFQDMEEAYGNSSNEKIETLTLSFVAFANFSIVQIHKLLGPH